LWLEIYPQAILAADAGETVINDREKAFENAWDTRDATAMAKLITDDYVMITRRGAMGGGKAFIEQFKNGGYADRDPKDSFPNAIWSFAFTAPAQQWSRLAGTEPLPSREGRARRALN
jgi:hypothetical protein